MKRHGFIKVALSLFYFPVLFGAARCGATTYSWNGSVSSDWFTTSNWTPPGVPGAADTINFTNGGTIILTSPVTIGVFNWSGGILGGKPMTVASGGVMNISGGGNLQNLLTNMGTVTMTGLASISLNNNGSTVFGGVYNLSGARWDFQTNATIYTSGSGDEFFNNAGTVLRSGGAGSSIYVSFTNSSGTVSNLVGSLYFYDGGTINGTYNTAAGATTYFGSGNFTMGTPPVIVGAGVCEFTGGTLTMTQTAATNLLLAGGNVILGPAFQNAGAITNLTLSGATLTGTNAVTGTMIWNGGIVNGPLTVKSSALLNITGSGSLYNVLTNLGAVTITGSGAVTINNNGSSVFGGVYNLAGARWDFQTNATIFTAGSGDEFFNNTGTVLRSGGTSTSIYVSFINSGMVSNLVGSLYFYGGGTINGTYNTAAGATTYFEAGSFTMGTPPVITGVGVCEYAGNTLTMTQTIATNLLLAGGNVILGPAFQNAGMITNLTLSGATLAGTNAVTGAMIWNGGIVNGPLTVKSGALLNIIGSGTLYNVLTNLGTVTITGSGAVTINNNGSTVFGGVYNLAGGRWDFQTNATVFTAGSGSDFSTIPAPSSGPGAPAHPSISLSPIRARYPILSAACISTAGAQLPAVTTRLRARQLLLKRAASRWARRLSLPVQEFVSMPETI